MALNEKVYVVKNPQTLYYRITSSSTVNTNLDATGTLYILNPLGSASPLALAEKAQVRKIVLAPTGSVTTATDVRFFKSSSTSLNSTNTAYHKSVLVPAQTVAVTSEIIVTERYFDDNEFMLMPGEYIAFAISASFTNGLNVFAYIDKFES